jgi:ABC-type multidrug transport system ATPase subunit/predicted component of type VI protein secretion system
MPDLGKLVVQQAGEEPQEVALKETTTFGRAPDNDVVLNDARVSRHHARLVYQNGRYVLRDLNSHNGTWVGSQRISEQEITPGTSFRIGPATITLQVAAAYVPPAPPPPFGGTVSFEFVPTAPAAQVERVRLDRPVLTLGREQSCDLVLDHPAVSRLHAQIRKVDNNFVLFDLKSTNGTFVNGQRVEVQHQLQVGDEIRIASYKIIFDGVAIAPQDEAGNIRLDAVGIRKVVGKGVVLLNNINLSIAPREFVAIVGVSGAGKSTLLDALNGFRPATEGAVLINGVNLYQNFDAYRTQLGYVPQEDIIHKELTVYEALDYAAQLRMPADTTSNERHKRIMEVLGDLNMVATKDRPIHRLSGGQRKRVSIGVELLTRPSLFYLDEATSGLDPGTEAQLMQLLALLADQGRTVMLVTHATKNVMLCDQVVFLAKGGNLAYFGPPTGALPYFGVQDFDQIYTKLEHEKSPQEWAERYQGSPPHRDYVEARLRTAPGVTAQAPSAAVVKQAPGSTVKRVSALGQLIVLSRRSLNILLRDRASLALMLLIAPLIGMMDLIMWKSNPFARQGGTASQGLIMLFLMALICILVGAVASMREIVKEADIYRRERMVTLKIIPYVMSKLWLGILLAAYQSVVFVLTKRLAAGWPDTGETIVATFVTLFLATLSGMLLGLLISAVSPNQNVAPLLLIMILVPQFMFAGGLMPVSTFGPAGKIISYATATKWGFESLVTISKLGKDVAEDPCWQLPKAQRDALLEKDKANCNCMGPNLFKKCNFPGLADLYDPAVDTPEPVQPKAPGDLPPQPPRPTPPASQTAEAQSKYQEDMQNYQKAMDAYQKDMEAYQAAAKKYQDDMETWRVRYQDWKAKHDKAISEGEGLIKKLYEDFGPMFKVKLATHWGWLAGITVVVFALVLLVQKRKDVV